MKESNQYTRASLLFLILSAFNILFTGCKSMVFRGEEEDIFKNGSILLINLPIYLEVAGFTINIFIVLLIIRLTIIDSPPNKLKLNRFIEVKFIGLFIFLLITALMAVLAIMFDLADMHNMYLVFFGSQILIIIYFTFNNVRLSEGYMGKITGKNESIAGRFSYKHLLNGILKNFGFVEKSDKEEQYEENN